jgi:hypothetical protein
MEPLWSLQVQSARSKASEMDAFAGRFVSERQPQPHLRARPPLRAVARACRGYSSWSRLVRDEATDPRADNPRHPPPMRTCATTSAPARRSSPPARKRRCGRRPGGRRLPLPPRAVTRHVVPPRRRVSGRARPRAVAAPSSRADAEPSAQAGPRYAPRSWGASFHCQEAVALQCERVPQQVLVLDREVAEARRVRPRGGSVAGSRERRAFVFRDTDEPVVEDVERPAGVARVALRSDLGETASGQDEVNIARSLTRKMSRSASRSSRRPGILKALEAGGGSSPSKTVPP